MPSTGYILLVEDNAADARLTRELLAEAGDGGALPLRWAPSLRQALALLDAERGCSAVLLDLGLPDSQGLDALRAVQLQAPECPVVVLTGDDSEASGLAALSGGAQDFLVKGSFGGGLLRRCLRFATQRKQAEMRLVRRALTAQHALAASAQRQVEAMARVDDGFVALDVAQRFSFVNPRALQLLGRDAEGALLGKHLWTEFPQFVGTSFHRALEEAVASQQPVRNESFYPRGRRWIASRLYPSPDGLSVYFTDVTDRRRAEQALRESEAYRRGLFEQLADGVLLTDHHRRIQDANLQAQTMLGYSLDELRALPADALFIDPASPRVDEAMTRLRDRQPYSAEIEFVCKDGRRFPAEVHARSFGDDRIVSVLRDISARRAAEKAMLQFQCDLSDLAQRLMLQERLTTQRLAQALHDQLGQTLAVARLNLEACIALHGAAMPDALKERSRRVAALIDQAVQQVRRVLADLRPPLLEEQGLAAALDNELRAPGFGGGADLLLELPDGEDPVRWPADVEYAAFMVAREATLNALRHAGASLIRVVLGGGLRTLRLEVIDDGRGMQTLDSGGRAGHLGLVGMRERAIAIGARFDVSARIEGGTRVALTWQAVDP
jgi:PAS domain S-box-containing protein